MRTDKELLLATKRYASEVRWVSWWCLISTLAAYGLCLGIVVSDAALWVRIFASCISGLVTVRLFIIYHDYEHGAILQKSLFVKLIMQLYGMLVLSPISVWNRSHDHHHKHNCKETAISIGSYPIMTCEQYASTSLIKRMNYNLARHPLTMIFGYLTVFMYGMCIRAFVLNPKHHLDSGIAILLHLFLIGWLSLYGLDAVLLCLILPLFIACGSGSYLFYAQHNFPGCKLTKKDDWSYVSAALKSSSYIEMGLIGRWFTGNIGYHHIHHLNAKIPFYRLPVAMAALEELQSPAVTSLSLRNILKCWSLKLWDPDLDQLVPFPKKHSAPSVQTHPVRTASRLTPEAGMRLASSVSRSVL
ncbi:MAG: fatty acid desaturase [Pirellulaceae bacterium]|nr:fatty acid desaturase [Pirellulaceae bacterium]